MVSKSAFSFSLNVTLYFDFEDFDRGRFYGRDDFSWLDLSVSCVEEMSTGGYTSSGFFSGSTYLLLRFGSKIEFSAATSGGVFCLNISRFGRVIKGFLFYPFSFAGLLSTFSAAF